MVDAVVLHNVDDTAWFHAPRPWRWHRCRPWTTARALPSQMIIERCACGAIRRDYVFWQERNSRR